MRGRVWRYEVGRLIYKPGSKPYVFHLVLDSDALSTPGVLGRVAGAFARRGVSILQLKVSAAEPLRLIVIADMRGREGMVGELCDELRRAPYVIDIQTAPPISEGLAIDTCSFPLTLLGQRVVMLRRNVCEGFIGGGWKRFGSGFGQLLYITGFDAGRRACEDHSHLAPSPDLQVKLGQALFQLLGYGRLRMVRVDDEKRFAVVRVYDSFECELFKGVGEVRGNFVRGLIAGWLAARWGIEDFEGIVAREEKCIAKGDPYCEYHIRGTAARVKYAARVKEKAATSAPKVLKSSSA